MKPIVHKILLHEQNQLWLLEEDGKFKVAIYNERTGDTLLRAVEATLENLERAVKILQGTDTGDF